MTGDGSANSRTETVFKGKNLEVVSIPLFLDNYLFALRRPGQNTYIMVDPGEPGPALDFLRRTGGTVSAILCTHEHSDHIGGAEELARQFPECKVVGAPSVRSYLPTLENRFIANDDDRVSIGGIEIGILRWYGHTADHLCFRIDEEDFLFCGDTLFGLGCGRIISGTYEQLFQSLQNIKALPADSRVFCSHEYSMRNLQFIKEKLTAFPASFLNREAPTAEKLAGLRDLLSARLEKEKTTVPLSLRFELENNPFLRAADFGEFEAIRKLRNQY